MLQGLGTILGAMTVLIAAWIGSNTFNNWKLQKLSERKIEQAERILTATYNARRSLSMVRSPVMWGHETDAAEVFLKENGEWDKVLGSEAQGRLATKQAYYNRLNFARPAQLATNECLPMARALFGEQLETAMEKLNRQFSTVKVYVDANYRDKTGADSKFRRKIESAIWEGYPTPEENEVDKTISEQVKVIEDICLPVLRLEPEAPKLKKRTLKSLLSSLFAKREVG